MCSSKIAFATALALLAWAPRAHAIQSCPASVYPCYTQYYFIVCDGTQNPRRTHPPLAHTKGKTAIPTPNILCPDGYHCEEGGITYVGAGVACTDDGNACTTDQCNGSGTCNHDAVAGTPGCTDDGNACTLDYCSGGVCTHPADTGAACSDDGNPCTTDQCNSSGQCAHSNPTGGSNCAGTCIAAGTCCNNPNSCTGGRTCSGVGGSCGCPGGTFDCAGSCISTSTCCNNPNSCGGGKVCSGAGGSCSCPAGTYDCGGSCISNPTCCTSPDNCPDPANGTGTCASNGGACSVSCNSGYKMCGSACIPNAQCCYDSECTSAGANQHGVCSSGTCTYPCNNGYKQCGGACIPTGQCCNSTECTSPPSGCYKTQGTCSSGACSYAYNDGAACNADSTKCTPNDKCMSGTCVADTANTVVCVKRDCHTTPACNPATGNCDDATVPDTTPCGGNGCSDTTGSCTGGTCSVTPKVCSGLDTDCKVGMCDASSPIGTPCATVNKMNGLTCNLADKCLEAPACSGGSCIGTPKECPPSGECRIAMCNSSTGGCEESTSPVGTACVPDKQCVQNAQCDATGACVGSGVPDGTPCLEDGCMGTSACVTGECICIETPDMGELQPIVPGAEPDMSVDGDGGEGCSMGGRPASSPWWLALCLVGLALRRRVRIAR
jgi:hypothetical protein